MKMHLFTANKSKMTRFPLPTTHLTTLGLAEFKPINILPLLQGDRVTGSFGQISRTQPTAVQTFGAFKLKTYAFFTPFKTIWKGYEKWKEDTPDSSVSKLPLNFTMLDLLEGLFGGSLTASTSDNVTLLDTFSLVRCGSVGVDFYKTLFSNSTIGDNDVPLDNADFVVIDQLQRTGSGTSAYYSASGKAYNLTAKGRRLYNILLGLGYNIPHRISLFEPTPTSGAPYVTASSSIADHILQLPLSALPLLAFGRFLYDYVYPSMYVQQQGFGYLFESDLDASDVANWLAKLFDLVFVPYEQDFFNSLWLKPNQVSVGTGFSGSQVNGITVSDFQGANLTGSRQMVASDSDATVVASRAYDTTDGYVPNYTPTTMSATALRWLQSVSDFCMRNNIGGTRFHEYMKSHFGFVTQEQDSMRSKFIKSWVDVVNFDAVTATTSTDTQLLGERAGTGSSNGRGNFTFEAKEEGFLMFAVMVVPSTAYYQGLAPWCEALDSRFKLYTPEIDSVGFEAIPRARLFSCYERGADLDKVPVTTLRNAFGFGHRYADMYKVSRDFLTGDFRLPSIKGMDSYHTFRDVLYGRNNLALDARFMQADNQYDRVYAVNPTDENGSSYYDKIETLFLFDLTKYSHMLSISESLPIFNKSGRDTEVNYEGTQL